MIGIPADRRSRKRMATRQAISDAATRLFFLRGFDRVTIDEIAEAADVGRMTVFNYFPRKEDMFFDRGQEISGIAFEAIHARIAGTTPIEALGMLAHHLIAQPHPFFPPFEDSQRFLEIALASEALKARAREMRDDFVAALAVALAEAVDQPGDDTNACLAAGLIASTWSVAFTQAHRVFARHRDPAEARRTFLALVDRGMIGTKAALVDTAYA